MNTHTADCETNVSSQKMQDGISDKLLLISHYVIVVLALVLAVILLLTLFEVGWNC